MIPTNKTDGLINNLVGLCLINGYSHKDIANLKKYINSHLMINDKCSECDFSLKELRYYITNKIKNELTLSMFLSCNERIIKKMLE